VLLMGVPAAVWAAAGSAASDAQVSAALSVHATFRPALIPPEIIGSHPCSRVKIDGAA
jgi:hypothetical protein